MATIEERARQYATKLVGGEYVGGYKGEVWLDLYTKYIEIATEQRKIDIEKACECFRQELKHFVRMLDCIKEKSGEMIDIEGSIESFRKAMEE